MRIKPGVIVVVSVYFILLHVGFTYLVLEKRTLDKSELFRTALHQYYTRRDASVTNEAIILLGDSHTHALCAGCLAQRAVNYGIPSITSAELLGNLKSYRALNASSVILLQIGHNDLKHSTNTQIIATLEDVIAALPSKPRKIVTLQFPVVESIRPELTGYNRRKETLNTALVSLCDGICEILDIGPELTPSHFESDGVHLSPAGNRLWINRLRSKISVST